ncbi:50S ribosomal protein L13 [archaeon]|nr:50S ribosomal protein L13 [archaeon]|tara:strand:- start:4843 stop:5256 length:414 start_codon:yes stop_codon:yes gene_type:complete
MVVIDGTDAVLGRLCVAVSKEAKKLKDDETIDVINVEKVIITGNPKKIEAFYKQRIDKGERYHGPFFPRRPDGIFRRALRGMIAYKRKSGRDMFSKIKIHNGVPKGVKTDDVKKMGVKEVRCKYITLEKLSQKVGGI